jgi:hypothetical protein
MRSGCADGVEGDAQPSSREADAAEVAAPAVSSGEDQVAVAGNNALQQGEVSDSVTGDNERLGQPAQPVALLEV